MFEVAKGVARVFISKLKTPTQLAARTSAIQKKKLGLVSPQKRFLEPPVRSAGRHTWTFWTASQLAPGCALLREPLQEGKRVLGLVSHRQADLTL
jgi:hypothetical protein